MSYQHKLKDASKINWQASVNKEGGYPGDINIQLGCLMRIADATEAMAANHVNLQNDLKYMKESRDGYQRLYENKKKECTVLKTQVTKLKNKLKNNELENVRNCNS